MGHSSREFDLTSESNDRILIARIPTEEFERDDFIELEIANSIHGPHPACADVAEHFGPAADLGCAVKEASHGTMCIRRDDRPECGAAAISRSKSRNADSSSVSATASASFNIDHRMRGLDWRCVDAYGRWD